MIVYLIILTIVLSLTGYEAVFHAPEKISAWYAGKYAYEQIINMTEWIAKDATVKLRHADRVQQRYRHMLAYHLGSIMSGIQDNFRHMLKIYRKFSNITEFRAGKYNIEELFNAYQIIKGDFNELRHQKELFYKVVNDYKQKEQKREKQRDRFRNVLDRFKDRLADAAESRRSASVNRSADGWAEGKGKGLAKGVEREKEEEYKRDLRLRAWESRWKQFAPRIEGVDINIPDIDPETGKPRKGAV